MSPRVLERWLGRAGSQMRGLALAALAAAEWGECEGAFWQNHIFYRKCSSVIHRNTNAWDVMDAEGTAR